MNKEVMDKLSKILEDAPTTTEVMLSNILSRIEIDAYESQELILVRLVASLSKELIEDLTDLSAIQSKVDIIHELIGELSSSTFRGQWAEVVSRVRLQVILSSTTEGRNLKLNKGDSEKEVVREMNYEPETTMDMKVTKRGDH